nr:MAG TPA: hypothetical protein [Caudoviricetes sp.]
MLIYKQLVYLECYITTLRIQLHSNYHVTLHIYQNAYLQTISIPRMLHNNFTHSIAF